MKITYKIISIFLFIMFKFILTLDEKWIVVTTINYPTSAIKKLAGQEGWRVVVVADKKTPKDWHCDNCDFISVDKQLELNYEIVKYLPWNHYSRKNIGYLYAIENGATVIYETDDDNIINNSLEYYPEFCEMDVLQNNSVCANPYAYFGQPSVWPRGYPLEYVLNETEKIYERKHIKAYIQQGLVNNDPDVDAIFRLTRGEQLTFIEQNPICLPKGIMSPFNSQNTIFHYNAFWGLFIPMTTSFRVCDIWRGYVMQRLLWDIGGNLCFTKATAIQQRNAHNLLKDFIEEQDLYCKAGQLVHFLLNWKSQKTTLFDRILELHKELVIAGFYKNKEIGLMKAWLYDLESVGYQKPLLE